MSVYYSCHNKLYIVQYSSEEYLNNHVLGLSQEKTTKTPTCLNSSFF